MSDDLLEGRDLLEQDMATHQRRRGEVTALENQALAADAMLQLENVQRDAKPTPAPADPSPTFTGERDGKHGTYLLGQSASDDLRTRPATAPEAWFMQHAMPRLELLLSKRDTGPLGAASWYQRVLAVMELQSRAASFRLQGLEESAKDAERRYVFELVKVLDDSDAVFKPSWKADAAARPLQVQVR